MRPEPSAAVPRWRGVRSLILSVLALAVAITSCGDDPQTQVSDAASVPLLGTLEAGQPLPDASLPRLDGEGELHTAELRGEPAVVNFWATWCPFCVEEMPDLEAVHRELGDEVRFVGVDKEDDLDKARTLARQTGVTYEQVVDADGSFYRAVQARGMPTTVLVDRHGRIVHRHAGPLTAHELRALIAQHLRHVDG
ncbi:MAG: TlpA family protein disulfide reductase [Actinomycetota bacterium]|nr:TlpA family protein disulfide reductase [Actinomycetota bacterium]